MKVLRFFSPTCGPCRVMGEKLKNLQGCEIEEIDATRAEGMEKAELYGVRSIPTCVLVDDNGVMIQSFKGVFDISELQSVIDSKKNA